MVPTPEDSYARHDIVISAEILKVEDIGELPDKNIPAKMGNMDVYDRYDIRVIETFKGKFPNKKQIIMSNYWGDGFKKGQKVLIYLKNHGKYFVITLCSGSRELKFSKEAVTMLRKLSTKKTETKK